MSFCYRDLISLFNQSFAATYNTRLVRGDDEPIYLPADAEVDHHRIIFAHGFFASALHEIAHWLLAGEARRTQVDYGYWYCPDGRDGEQQQQFEAVEIKPQAIEWALSLCCGFHFNVSCDNLNGSVEPDRHAFKAKVREQALRYLEQGFPPRAQTLMAALRHHYRRPALTAADFG
ncbi:elongation factor P hydroxylase [Oceanisphaera psychrotolerans]|uniref:Elongation factor P hydroxylase n=1 Tax=Oceanisphaera psychrotolerans TaxID=1414654 RepID=A0A1J4QCM2_9GAMM|nr:elongation factor P hydroxylase [Oceanisphaera psychrotolerans]OIN07945.1 elongation factor P hydroxylase [Oceanisphaera psychrotolerans]